MRIPEPDQVLYRDRKDAERAARARGCEGTHKHTVDGETHHMPCKTHGAYHDNGGDSTGTDRSGGLIGDGIADRLNSLYADSDDDDGDADTGMADSGMGGGFAEFADLRPRGDADPVDTRTETDDDLLNSQFGGAPVPMERDPDTGETGPDPFAIGNFGEFNSPYDTDDEEEDKYE